MLEPDTKESGNTPQNSSGQGLFINDLKNRLLQVEGKETKEAVHLPTVGASTLKRTYEKLSAKDEVTLLGPRTIKLQTGVDEAAINSGVKSLEQIKAEKAETNWKWKNKSHHDLYEHMREYDQNASEEIKDKQEKLQRAEEELNRQEVLAKTEEEIENIKKLREEKENSKIDEISLKKPFVCVINMQGYICPAGPISMQCYREVIDEAFEHENLEEVILNVNSWGGSLIQADLITTYIKEKSVKHNVPVVSFIEDTATSCGYWLACAGTEIYACRNSLGKSSLRFHP